MNEKCEKKYPIHACLAFQYGVSSLDATNEKYSSYDVREEDIHRNREVKEYSNNARLRIKLEGETILKFLFFLLHFRRIKDNEAIFSSNTAYCDDKRTQWNTSIDQRKRGGVDGRSKQRAIVMKDLNDYFDFCARVQRVEN